jgi:hypothetical protein
VESASALHSHLNEFKAQQQTFFYNLQTESEMQNKMVIRMINTTKSVEKSLQKIGLESPSASARGGRSPPAGGIRTGDKRLFIQHFSFP